MTRGFTLVELLVVLFVIGALASIGLGSMNAWTGGRKVRAAAEMVRDGLMGARAEAIRRNRTVRAYVLGSTFATEVPAFADEAKIALQQTRLQAPVTQGEVFFSSDGRTSPPGASHSFTATGQELACKSAGGPLDCFTVQVSSAGSVRLCDPAVAPLDSSGARNPRACR